jgi:hypothetical protein
MNYATPAWEFAAYTHVIKLQGLENKVPLTIGNYQTPTLVRDFHTVFHYPYVYDYITNLRRQQAEIILKDDNEIFRNTGQGEARHRKYKRLKFYDGQAYDRSSDLDCRCSERYQE